ncbi:MAG TPA: hypothetical protein VMT58_08220 [Candidatus Binataceae bacterium]|nr:hypothetical protein [Candidatus Binataceae bacterium]
METAMPVCAAAGEEAVPDTSVVPAAASTSPASPISPNPTPAETGAAAVPKAKRPHHMAHHPARAASAPEVEPATARLLVLKNGWAYEEPAKSSGRVQAITAGKYVNVTGNTRYYLRVQLRTGKIAYVEQSAVELVRPIDKVWRLHRNADVREKPNMWAKKVSEVHQGHDVHAVGIAPNYVKIRMKSGLEGFVPTSALE